MPPQPVLLVRLSLTRPFFVAVRNSRRRMRSAGTLWNVGREVGPTQGDREARLW
jgi:hypothetical protein